VVKERERVWSERGFGVRVRGSGEGESGEKESVWVERKGSEREVARR
jgi:hypothetical protein